MITLLLAATCLAVSTRSKVQNKLTIENKLKGVDAQAFLQSLRLKHLQERNQNTVSVDVAEDELLEVAPQQPEFVQDPDGRESVFAETGNDLEFLRTTKNA